MAFRFVHAADIHLDSPLRSLAMRNRDLAELVNNASRRAFVSIIDLCLDEQVDALIIAGDLYDGEQTSMKTARFLAEQLLRLHQAGTKTFIIRGNHDALSKITKELTLPDSVKLFGHRAEAISFERPKGKTPIFIHGLSFAKPQAPESLLGKYKAPIEGAVNIGLMHTSLDGTFGHDLYAPCSVKDLQNSGFQYWGLGHIHKRAAVLHKNNVIVMPGIPQGRDINEAGPKSVTLVTVRDDKTIEIDERFTSIAQFERLELSVNGLTDWRTLIEKFGKVFERARSDTDAEHLIMRLNLSGTTPLAWQVRRDIDLLHAELELYVTPDKRSWIEKIEVNCIPPNLDTTQLNDPLLELRGLISDDILDSEGFSQYAADLAKELQKELPQECRNIFGKDEAAVKAALQSLAKVGTDDVLARLQAQAAEI